MKKEFPFGWAFLFALVVHALVGIFLKQNPLLIAAPIPPSNANGPVKMHFVESPDQAKSVPQKPDSKYLSDATRKAGPLVKSEKREQKSTQYALKSPGLKQPSPPAPRSRRSTPGGQPEQEVASLPPIERPALEQTPGTGDYRIPPSGPRDEKKLSNSLQNLDQFIGKGEGSGTQGSDVGDGDLPSGDPGSGVFFDTQGFDLGPWANRVVAIVRSNWIVPVAAQLGVKGVVSVAFKVERAGRIIDIRVISPSGTPSFDQAAINALKTSSPFPALPADFPRPVLPGIFRFYYNVPVPQQ